MAALSHLVKCRHCEHKFRVDPKPYWDVFGAPVWTKCRRCDHDVTDAPPPGGWVMT